MVEFNKSGIVYGSFNTKVFALNSQVSKALSSVIKMNQLYLGN